MPDESFLVLSCTCGQRMKIPADAMGKTFKCVRCAQHVTASDRTVEGRKPEARAETPQTLPTEPIGEQLINAGLINDEQLHEALSLQRTEGGKTLENLIKLGYLDKDRLHAYLSRLPGMAGIELSRFNIDSVLLELIPRELAQQNLVLPIDRLGKLLTVAMACPLDKATIGEVERLTGLRVKPMLCRLDDLNAAVKKYYGGERDGEKVELTASHFGLSMAPKRAAEDVREIIPGLASLPVSPVVAGQLQSELNGKSPSSVILLSLLRQDPVLAAMLLRTANSVTYGMSGKVDNIAVALTLVGQDGLRQLLEYWKCAPDDKDGPVAKWRNRAHLRSQIAEEVARVAGSVGPAAAGTAGLLADLGRFVLAHVAPERYGEVDAGLRGEALIEAERGVLTMSHNEAGANLAASWQYPPSVYEVMKCYPKPGEAETSGDLAAVVQAADFLAGTKGAPEAATMELLAKLGVDESKLGLILQAVS
ncbi:MAG: HDOD domain-containing protein [Candidatus Hydrogenedentes bacterium]|nr:HDOD domain-containing protein [Candidatus Hydrogenedentota bacterium]